MEDLLEEFIDILNSASTEELYVFLEELQKEIDSREEEE